MKNIFIVLFAWMIWCDGSNGIISNEPIFFEDKQRAVDKLKESWRPEWIEWNKDMDARAGCDFYEIKKVDYTVDVKTETTTVISEHEETVELGREIKWEDQ